MPEKRDDVEVSVERELRAMIRAQSWVMRLLHAVRDEDLPDAWVGAGLLRDLVWGERYGHGFDPQKVRDVDVAFFDPADLSRAHDDAVTSRLCRRLTDIPWEAKNQAAVHTWYPHRFGGVPVEPFTSIRDAVASWPETATAVAVRLTPEDRIQVCAPYGLDDLLGGKWRRNPNRISVEQSLARLRRHTPADRLPGITVITPISDRTSARSPEQLS